MDAERRPGTNNLKSLFTQGDGVADSLEFISDLDYIRFVNSESPGSKVYYRERSVVLRSAAEKIQNTLSWLKQRLSQIGPEPEK